MTLLHLLSYVGGLAGFLFVTLSLASGLLWLAELIEEHSRYAKVIGMRAIYTIIVIHVLLYFTDSLPLLPILFSIFCHIIYLQNFSSSWPYISLTSLKFIASCLLVVADHFTWFFHFAQKAQEAKKYRGPKYRYGGAKINDTENEPTFMDVAAFFAVCVWFVPLFLFLSLSANDNALPSLHASAPPSPRLGPAGTVDLSSPSLTQALRQSQPRIKTSLVKSILSPIVSVLPRIRSRGSKREASSEGIIAPRTPVRGSPLHSPVPMQQSYFPWGDETPPSNSSRSLTPDHRQSLGTGTTPSGSVSSIGLGLKHPPPRRIASEANVSGVNPRGIATRNGQPFASDEFMTEPESYNHKTGSSTTSLAGDLSGKTKVGLGAAGRSIPQRPNSPSMSLGPEKAEKLGDVEVVVSRSSKKED